MRSVYEPAISPIADFCNPGISVVAHGTALIVGTDNEAVVIDTTTEKVVARSHNRGTRLYIDFWTLENAPVDVQMEVTEMALKALESQTCAMESTLDQLTEKKDFKAEDEDLEA